MDDSLGAKIATVTVLAAICLSGYLITSTSADLAGTNHMVTLSPSVTLRQGNGVNYTFVATATLPSIQFKQTSIVLGSLEVGATTTAGQLNNQLIAYGTTYVKWTATNSNANAVVTYTLTGVPASKGFELLVDNVQFQLLSSTSGGVASFSFGWAGAWTGGAPHLFVLGLYSVPEGTPAIHADFDYRIEGTTVHFTDQSNGMISSWAWNFGDGTFSSEKSPSHRYTQQSAYNVTLVVYGVAGTSSTCKKLVSVGPGGPGSVAGYSIELLIVAGAIFIAVVVIAVTRRPGIALAVAVIIIVVGLVLLRFGGITPA